MKEGLILNTAFKLVEFLKDEPWGEVAKALELFAILAGECDHQIVFSRRQAVL